MFYIVGLGNPGEEYAITRHNVGRMAVSYLADQFGAEGFKADKVLKADKVKVQIPAPESQGSSVTPAMLILPNTFMNKSGASVLPIINTPKKMDQLIVVHDDIDMPLGEVKIVFNRGFYTYTFHPGIVESILSRFRTHITKQF